MQTIGKLLGRTQTSGLPVVSALSSSVASGSELMSKSSSAPQPEEVRASEMPSASEASVSEDATVER